MTRLFKIFLRNQALGSASVRQIAFHSFLSVTVCLGAFAQNQDTTPAPKPPIQQEAPPPEAPKPAPHKPDAEPPKPKKRTYKLRLLEMENRFGPRKSQLKMRETPSPTKMESAS